MRLLFLFLLQLLLSPLFSQEIKRGKEYDYARRIVDTMCSQSMHGRGYTNGGDSIAANYLRTEFQNFHLKSFSENYYQKLSFPVNTFPSNAIFMWEGLGELLIGKDFIISPSSGSAQMLKQLSKVSWLDSATFYNPGKLKKFLEKKCPRAYVAVDIPKISEREVIAFFTKTKPGIRGLIFIKRNKLTADFEQQQDPFPSVELLLHDNITLEKLKKKSLASIFYFNKLIPDHHSQNVIGYVEGSEHPDSFIVFSGHYDHIGEMGNALFPGANDNASGCAMLLNLAKYYSLPEHKPKCSIVFMAFCGEEVGLLGSKYYTEHPLFPLKHIKFLLNMDIMGTGGDGITAVNGTLFTKEFEKLKQINAENNLVKTVNIRGKAANSDHYFFSEKGVRAVFIYTMGGIKAYHDIYDRAETLPLNEFENLFKLIVKFGDYLQVTDN